MKDIGPCWGNRSAFNGMGSEAFNLWPTVCQACWLRSKKGGEEARGGEVGKEEGKTAAEKKRERKKRGRGRVDGGRGGDYGCKGAETCHGKLSSGILEICTIFFFAKVSL